MPWAAALRAPPSEFPARRWMSIWLFRGAGGRKGHGGHVYQLDIFPTTFFAHGEYEVRRRLMVQGTPLAGTAAVPMVSAEDIILAKLA